MAACQALAVLVRGGVAITGGCILASVHHRVIVSRAEVLVHVFACQDWALREQIRGSTGRLGKVWLVVEGMTARGR